MLWAALAVAAAAVAAYIVLVRKAPQRGEPPNPGWLPLLGSLLHVSEPIENELRAPAFTRQPIVVVYFGLEKIYYLNTFAAFKEALVTKGDRFLRRPQSTLMSEIGQQDAGIVMANGQKWMDYRRFTLKTLRDLGFGRQGAEEIISNEAQMLCELIDKQIDSPLDTVPLFSTAVSNVICQLVFGSRLASEDPKFERILEIFKIMTQSQNNVAIAFTFILNAKYFSALPSLLKLLSWFRKKRINIFQELLNFCKDQTEKHREETTDFSQARDYIEAHLLHQQSHPQFNDVRLTLSIADLFIAGTDTTSHTLRWAVIFMMENPEVAERVFQEINTHVGVERQVGTKDRAELHYTMAVLEEVNRCASLAPLAVFHSADEDATVCGYTIPKGSCVIYNIYNIHNSSDLFPEPHKFRPERFLDKSRHFVASEHVVPFGVGKRSCLGESLARMELLIFFSTLMQRYRFSLDPDDSRSLEEIKANEGSQGGGVRAPAAFRLVCSRR